MGKEILTLGDTKTEKRKFWYPKHPTVINNEDIDNSIISCQGFHQ